MYVVVNHRLRDAQKFFGAAKGEIPAHLKLHAVFPGADGARATCLWQAESIDALKDFVEGQVGRFADNEFIEVDAAHALGLPK
jgi:hypothetical protein